MSPGADSAQRTLEPTELRRVVWVLSITVIASYGVLYYAFPVLLTSIVDDTGWSSPAVVAPFSLSLIVAALVGIPLGRVMDRRGPRLVMTVGSLLTLPAILLIALAPNYGFFVAGWVAAGGAMAGTLYSPAFAALTHWSGPRHIATLTTLTLVAGLSSVFFAPLTAVLNGRFDWRTTYILLAVLLVAVTVPAHWFGLRYAWIPFEEERGREVGSRAGRSVARTRAFVLLAVSLSAASFAVYASLINLVPLLVEQGFSPGLAATALGLGGLGQVAGRLGYAALVARTSVTGRTVVVIGLVAATSGLLGVRHGSTSLLMTLAVLLGVARGVFTLIQATAVSDRWGVRGYATLNGLLTAPVMVTAAIAPFLGAYVADLLGGQSSAFLMLGLVAAFAAVVALGADPRLKEQK